MENEFDYVKSEASGFNQNAGALASGYGGLATTSGQGIDIPLLTYGEEVLNDLDLGSPLSLLHGCLSICLLQGIGLTSSDYV